MTQKCKNYVIIFNKHMLIFLCTDAERNYRKHKNENIHFLLVLRSFKDLAFFPLTSSKHFFEFEIFF